MSHDRIVQILARQINPQIIKLPDKTTGPCCILQKRGKRLVAHAGSQTLQGFMNGGIGIHDKGSLTKMRRILGDNLVTAKVSGWFIASPC